MAEPGLIAAYLTELRYSVAKLADVDDVVAEVEDHLLASVEAAVARGQRLADAEAEVLARFGSAALVSRVFIEEDKRGGAVSTTLTKRAGIAAVLAPPTMIVGAISANAGNSEQPLSGIGVTLCTAAAAAFFFGIIGLRARHGGMGLLGRVAFWLTVLALPIALPFSWAGLVILAVEIGVIVILLGIGMLRARILPRIPVALFAFTWPAWAPVAWVITEAGGDANAYALWPALVTFGAFMALGVAMWREPALDVRIGRGPFATA